MISDLESLRTKNSESFNVDRYCFSFKVTGIRPMAPVLNKVHLKVSEHEMLSLSVRKEIIKNDNSLVVILLSKVVENEFLQTV